MATNLNQGSINMKIIKFKDLKEGQILTTRITSTKYKVIDTDRKGGKIRIQNINDENYKPTWINEQLEHFQTNKNLGDKLWKTRK